MRNFRDFIIYQDSLHFSKQIYDLTSKFPSSEKFGLTNQIRRASVSIPSNIAEGASRNSEKSFSNFLQIALGSAFEVESQLQLSLLLKFIDETEHQKLLDQLTTIEKQINSFIQKLKPKGQ